MKTVLFIIIVVFNYRGLSVHTQEIEFNSMKRCEEALAIIDKDARVDGYCLPTGRLTRGDR